MPRTNGRAHHHKHYINRTSEEYRHKINCDKSAGNSAKLAQKTYTTPEIMLSNDDRTNNSDPSGLRGRRGDRTPCGKSRGRGFHFSLNAEMALTQRLMRKDRSLEPLATCNLPRHWQLPRRLAQRPQIRQERLSLSIRPRQHPRFWPHLPLPSFVPPRPT